MATKQIGQRVKVVGGMREFVGQFGTVVDNTERDGRTTMFRVRLDAPVEVPGVGHVRDDLWSGAHLRNVR